MKIPSVVQAIISILICEIAGVIGSIFTAPAIPTWYATLTRPDIAPPNWVFAPVWTFLFAFMGIAAFLVWKKGTDRKKVQTALVVFGVQLALNVEWSMIFFGFQNLGGALIEICILWVAIVATIILFARISRTAALLLLPYLAWVSFAGYLTYSFWTLN